MLCILCLVCACATVGRSFPPERVTSITRDSTTKAELLGHFGMPYRRGIDDGDSTWTWVHYKFRLFGEHMQTRDLIVTFDDAGRVTSYTYNSSF